MFKQHNQMNIGRIWMTMYFVVLILGCNHLYGYSLLGSFLDLIGIGSWTKVGEWGWHITSFITIPILLLSMIQTSRCMRARYPSIFLILFISLLIWSAVYPKLTEGIVSVGELILK
ncbi:hypothetical protein [Paenibacillus alvei]|uniref:hypothetical protein n=1 Tax=Paenibacillus alvei TaxID=44250 RepID=UPI0018CEB52D|nr:hypothetical protein [Paenibacillus alvei]MBG9733334.1 hypothetical protein [Paenibacillus alvei]MBG9745107.1 hypothetical protein [Paenibacillus alvei]MCY9580778.1 hypothetical protein [Paenibacillus alvei]MCY9585261.1 hypothetical protein [Paenibacillus alvei]